MPVSPTRIVAALAGRGTALKPGLPDFDAAGLAAIGYPWIHPDVVALVRTFDGFEGWDDGSLFCMWDIATILSGPAAAAGPDGYVAFGDYSIFADVLFCDPRDVARPVLGLEGRVLAPSYADFWSRLIDGAFDGRRQGPEA